MRSDDAGRVRALVLQGGGALGAFELGVARVLYRERAWRPDVVAGVSIGAITAALLARPKGGDPLAALEAFWREVTVDAPLAPGPLKAYASVFGNPHFFMPRTDVWSLPWWTSLYTVGALRETLAGLIDEDALADPRAHPAILVTATDVAAGEIAAFYSGEGGLTLDHLLASGSLPPYFPATTIGQRAYWDGGLFDNTPLGAVLDHLDPSGERRDEREIVVVNLFPNAGAPPANLGEVSQRALNLIFANKTASDLRLLERFNAVAGLFDTIREDPRWADLAASPAFTAADQGYIQVPNVITVTRKEAVDAGASGDFSPATIAARAKEGEHAAREAFAAKNRPKPRLVAA
ncbi:MAG TPA: patatin-like phospholipase family protein [Caulobacteraceae bacterium]|nr:patatin-like phospholipase family protein [Caulobacteraceae bacterium]